MMSLLEIY